MRDAAGILDLVNESGVLESNSCYAYFLMCRDFTETCVVAESAGEIVGFVIGYRPPARQHSLFVWQIGVSRKVRRRRLAHRMLAELLSRPANGSVRFLEATVAPSNLASRKMFESFAVENGLLFEERQTFNPEDFGDHEHEPESLIRLGCREGNSRCLGQVLKATPLKKESIGYEGF
jgi:L-2,4-diaminobutyric acid acetyltransferase